ncbi:hypothetical protein [Fibrella arboris]|uniref:hypothetical protein n=1 Tax=Fibrella arboris TaxID=3242486 RepID=UPI0035218B2B
MRANDLDQITTLAPSVKLNQFYEQDMTLLIWAMMQKQAAAFRLLLRLGADPNLKDSENTQPVALAAGVSDQNKHLKILLESGGDPNSYQQKRPAVLVALLSDFWDNVLILLDAGYRCPLRKRRIKDGSIRFGQGSWARADPKNTMPSAAEQ